MCIDKRNSVANTKELVDMINGDSLIEAKHHLGKVLALVEDAFHFFFVNFFVLFFFCIECSISERKIHHNLSNIFFYIQLVFVFGGALLPCNLQLPKKKNLAKKKSKNCQYNFFDFIFV